MDTSQCAPDDSSTLVDIEDCDGPDVSEGFSHTESELQRHGRASEEVNQ